MDTSTLTLNSSPLFLSSFSIFAADARQVPPLKSIQLLSCGSPLPSLPSFLPASKIIPNTRFIVDGFRAAGDFSISYFLSHFHSDHYTGLNPNWCRGLIFCSETTASLLVEILKVSPLFVYALPLNKTVTIDRSNVVLLDANHCPGAVQFLFEVGLSRYIHTGDFRFRESMKLDPFLQKFVGADTVFLDTTYCNPKFVFPSQEESIEYILKTIQRTREENQGSSSKSVLFLIATYMVGKERILLEIAQKCNCLLHVDGRKMEILSVLGLGDAGVFTEDASSSDVHVIGWNLLGEVWPFFKPNFVKMEEIMLEKGYSRVIGFVSTGWMYEAKKDGFAVTSKGPLEIHLVPYSEHSSYAELREYVKFLRPKRVVPTVGVDLEKPCNKHAMAVQKYFRGLIDETANKHEFLTPFHQKAVNADAKPTSMNEPAENVVVEDVEEFVPMAPLSEEENCPLGDVKLVKEGDMEAEVEELRHCLPSWVNGDLMLSLIRGANGDVVQAVSDFFERETEYFNHSNVSTQPILHAEANSRNVFLPTPDLTFCEGPRSSVHYKSSQDVKNMGIKKLGIGSSSATNRKGSSSMKGKRGKASLTLDPCSKTKKKGKASITIDSCGAKQSTITKFFGNSALLSTNDDDHMMIAASVSLNKDKLAVVDSIEPYKHEVDKFLQVINFSIDRNAAEYLMDKAEGNIDVAVNMYYSSCDDALFKEDTLLSHTAPGVGHAKSCTGESRILSEEKLNVYRMSVGGTSKDYLNVNVLLPIEKYSPIEHGQAVGQHRLKRTEETEHQTKLLGRTSSNLPEQNRAQLQYSLGKTEHTIQIQTPT
ncbi:DNA cross-link repair protein SNM1 [Platanthera guangdongensis]|uniref:DNA cross-link repair protein SNM1 n=1 Tax=Platanthera guangdongensis TaxID=2320717 RepID=A0ABR2N2Z4_9ASPA